jgi:hypothetical protein
MAHAMGYLLPLLRSSVIHTVLLSDRGATKWVRFPGSKTCNLA